jgi:AraC-like DNA-binding protein
VPGYGSRVLPTTAGGRPARPSALGFAVHPVLAMTLASVVEVFEGVPNVLACIKDREGRYCYANRAFTERAGRRRPADVLGCTAGDLFPADLAARYDAQDQSVLDTGRPLHNQLELIWHGRGPQNWAVTAKSRLLNEQAEPVGVLAVSVDVGVAARIETAPDDLVDAIDWVRAHLDQPIRVGDLAVQASLSSQRLDGAVRRAFGLSPKQLIQRLRFDEALHLLSHSMQPIADIAVTCGFYDQPTFARRFRAVTGLTPAQYRASHPLTVIRSRSAR